jgi:hypothetical protein
MKEGKQSFDSENQSQTIAVYQARAHQIKDLQVPHLGFRWTWRINFSVLSTWQSSKEFLLCPDANLGIKIQKRSMSANGMPNNTFPWNGKVLHMFADQSFWINNEDSKIGKQGDVSTTFERHFHMSVTSENVWVGVIDSIHFHSVNTRSLVVSKPPKALIIDLSLLCWLF